METELIKGDDMVGDKEVTKLIEFITSYSRGEYIYLQALSRKLEDNKHKKSIVKKVLELTTLQGITEKKISCRCSTCNESSNIFNSIDEVEEEELYCLNCDSLEPYSIEDLYRKL